MRATVTYFPSFLSSSGLFSGRRPARADMQDADAKRPRRDIIELNVGGTHFATGRSTLELSGSV